MSATFVRPPTFSEHDQKSSEVHRLLATLGDHRLDASEAVSLAIDVFADPKFVELIHPEDSTRGALQLLAADRYRRLRNVGLAVRALDLLRSEA